MTNTKDSKKKPKDEVRFMLLSILDQINLGVDRASAADKEHKIFIFQLLKSVPQVKNKIKHASLDL